MQLLPLGKTTLWEIKLLHRDDPDGVYRSVDRISDWGVLDPFPTFFKRGSRIASRDWRENWRGEDLRSSTFFRVDYIREIEEGDPL